jgi:hypothetical protein
VGVSGQRVTPWKKEKYISCHKTEKGFYRNSFVQNMFFGAVFIYFSTAVHTACHSNEINV